MKKSSFVAMLLGTISSIPEWDAFQPGIIFGSIGLVLGLITIVIWRKMEHKQPIQISGKTILTIIVGVIGALALGVGMCFCMVWSKMVIGIIIGLIGIVVLLSLIPLVKGIKD